MAMKDWSYSPTNHRDCRVYECNIFKIDENNSACFIPDNVDDTCAGEFEKLFLYSLKCCYTLPSAKN